MKKALLLLIIMLIPFAYSQAACGPGELPKIIAESIYSANTGEFFYADINTTAIYDRVTFSILPLNSNINDISIGRDTGIISFKVLKEHSAVSTFLLIATTEKGCYDTKKIAISVYDKPAFTEISPDDESVEIKETGFVKFYAKANSTTPPLAYTWHLDNSLVASGNFYTYVSDYSGSGTHIVKVYAKDSRGLNSSHQWIIKVGNKNRPPYIRYSLPNIAVNQQNKVLLNLYDYIFDPDFEKLKFEVIYQDIYNSMRTSNTSQYFSLKTDGIGDLYVTWDNIPTAPQGIMIKAADAASEFVISPVFYLKVAVPENYTYYLLNDTANTTDECKVSIICRDWSECLSTGIRTRECYDYHNCNKQNKTYTEFEKCDYRATCFDRIKNQGEEDVDCGGPCSPCETCSDKIQNQGEEDVDCGGPCNPCPSCDDGIKNQDESDIDCGGACKGCESGMKCSQHNDCASLVCTQGICSEPTCNDSRKNQGEYNIDCGGPCNPCETCFDSIKNQNEEGVDCGGTCKACETCYDKIKNQKEFLTDCGGPCSRCSFAFIVSSFKFYIAAILFLILFAGIYIPLRIRYERDRTGFLMDFSAYMRFMPKNIPYNYSQIISQAKSELENLKSNVVNGEDNALLETYFSSINTLYSMLFEIEGSFGETALKQSIGQHIKNPFLAELFFEIYREAVRISPGKSFFKVELQEKIIELLKTLEKIEQLL